MCNKYSVKEKNEESGAEKEQNELCADELMVSSTFREANGGNRVTKKDEERKGWWLEGEF